MGSKSATGNLSEMAFCSLKRQSFLAQRTSSFRPSPIQQLSHLAQQKNAINLAEGFPDFPAPAEIKEAAIAAITHDLNQYRHVQGVCEKVAENFAIVQGVQVDPQNVILCCGQSEAMAASMLAVVDDGDEILLLDPAYETYESCILLAGGIPVYVSMVPPNWTLDMERLEARITPRTKAIVINSPHNPTGKVMSKEELEGIANICLKHDLLAITDEVYENIIFGSTKHVSLASLPNMLERTIVTSSLSKTYSVTGWRVGWAIAPSSLSSAIRNIHIKMTDSAPAPFQEAALVALQSSPMFYSTLRKEYEERRDIVCNMLRDAHFKVHFKPEGSFFVFAEIPESPSKNDVEFVLDIIEKINVVVVPGCGFFHLHGNSLNGEGSDTNEHKTTIQNSFVSTNWSVSGSMSTSDFDYQRRYVRVAFCKDTHTLNMAAKAFSALVTHL